MSDNISFAGNVSPCIQRCTVIYIDHTSGKHLYVTVCSCGFTHACATGSKALTAYAYRTINIDCRAIRNSKRTEGILCFNNFHIVRLIRIESIVSVKRDQQCYSLRN